MSLATRQAATSANQEAAAEVMTVLGRIAEGMGVLGQLLSAQVTNTVLYEGQVVLDNNGLWSKSWSVPFANVSVDNHTGATITAWTGAVDQTPNQGVGSMRVKPWAACAKNMAERTLNISGPAGGSVDVILSVRPQPSAFAGTVPKGNKSANLQVAVVSGAGQLIVPANTLRKSVLLFNNGPGVIFVGRDATVTTANGMPIGPGLSMSDRESVDAWFATSASTSDFRGIEVA
jgi:hypothetical protein